MRSSTKRFYSLILGLAFFVGAIYVYSNFIRAAYEEVKNLRGERAAELRLLEQSRSAVEIVDAVNAKYQSLATFQNSVSQALPIGEEIPSILNQVQGIAPLDNRKIEIDSISFQYLPIEYSKQPTTLRPYGAIRLSLRLRGTYGDLTSFVFALERNIRILNANSLKISGGGQGTNPNLTADLTVDAYYQTKN